MSLITGTSANDTLSAAGGEHTLAGGGGDDVYQVDSAGDTVQELAPAAPIALVSSSLLGRTAIGSTEESAISGSGRYIAFQGTGRDIGLIPFLTSSAKDLLLRDLDTNAVLRVSATPDGSPGTFGGSRLEVSYDGRYVAFENRSPNLGTVATAGGNILVKDMTTGAIVNASSSAAGVIGNSPAYGPSMSANGRYLAFETFASNLVPGAASGGVFVKDLQTGAIVLASSSSTGASGEGTSGSASISDDGRYVVFTSTASNLVPGDTNSLRDDFLKDLLTGALTRIYTAVDGVDTVSSSLRNGVISGNGQFYVFESFANNLVPNDTNNTRDVFIKNLQTGAVSRVSSSADGTQANGASSSAQTDGFAVSADGRFVAFVSAASNLVFGDTNGAADVFVKNTVSGEIVRLSASAAGVQGNQASQTVGISDDGRLITFGTRAGNLTTGDSNTATDVYVAGNPLLNGGTDTVRASVNFTLPANVENLVLGGNGLLGAGNGLDNRLTNAGNNNRLDGADGRDIAVIAGARAEFTVAKVGTEFAVSSTSAGGDSVRLTGVEAIEFTDHGYELQAPARTSAPVYAQTPAFLFDPVYYLLANPQLVPTYTVATAFQNYFSAGGASQGLRPNAWFDATYYQNRWDDLRGAGLDAATLFSHYNLYGVWEGRSAGPKLDAFDGTRYLNDNPDVAAYVDAYVADFLGSRSNGAIAHYIIYGAAEGRTAFDSGGQTIDLGYVL